MGKVNVNGRKSVKKPLSWDTIIYNMRKNVRLTKHTASLYFQG